MIHAINYGITKAFNILLYPFDRLPDFWGLLFLSILVSLVVLLVYKFISSPRKIKETKNQIKASILSIRLYKDFWRVILASFFKSLWYTLKYFFLNFGPVLLIIPLLFPVLAQMDARYGMKPFDVGDSFMLSAVFDDGVGQRDIRLLPGETVTPAMNPVFIDAYTDEDRRHPIHEVNWKLRTVKNGATGLRIRVDGREFTKQVVVGPFRGPLSNKKFARSRIDHFLYPVEDLLKDGEHLREISLSYPGKTVSVLGLPIHWLLLHLILVVVIVLGLRKKFGVEF